MVKLHLRRHSNDTSDRFVVPKTVKDFPAPQECKSSNFPDNSTSTSHYSLLNFVPKNLKEQFSKLSNAYFLLILCLQCIKPISVTNGLPSIGIPLSFVVVVNAIKDAIEDRKRHQADRLENNQEATVLNLRTDEQNRLENERANLVRLSMRPFTPCDPGSEEKRLLETSALRGRKSQHLDQVPRRQSLLQWPQSSSGSSITDTMSRSSGDPQTDAAPDVQKLKNEMERVRWRDVAVGDLIVVFGDQVVPADCVLIASSDTRGTVFIETSSLDGETSLKVKHSPPDCQRCVSSSILHDQVSTDVDHEQILLNTASMNVAVQCSPPSADLRAFQGTMIIHQGDLPGTIWKGISDDGASSIKRPLDTNQLLLRGCRICHTAFVVGLVVYTGREAKIKLNSASSRRKTSAVERTTHKLVLYIFIFMLVLCAVAAINSAILFTNEGNIEKRYLDLERVKPFYSIYGGEPRDGSRTDSAGRIGVVSFFTWIILYSNMVPISLVVSMGIVKAIQGWHMSCDRAMYDRKTKTYTVVRTSDLNEELGQISHIMTDKTGTLTANVMYFRKVAVDGIVYGRGLTEMRRMLLQRAGNKEWDEVESDPKETSHKTPHVKCVAPELREALAGATGLDRKQQIALFLLNLATNHSVLVDQSGGVPIDTGVSVKYIASSPDEEALVYGARHFGFAFLSRDGSSVLNLNILNRFYQLEIIAYFEFSSERKRSSALVRMPSELKRLVFNPEGHSDYILFVKGADSVVLPRCLESSIKEGKENLDQFANDCLRTLTLAYKEMSEKEVNLWFDQYKEASMALEDRPMMIAKTAEAIEQDLIFQGVTGIEDQLAQGVADTISDLSKAGIKIWMLTGDKFETAMNIGLATQMIRPNYIQINFTKDRALKKRRFESNRTDEESDTLKDCLDLLISSIRRSKNPPSKSQSAASLQSLRSLVGVGDDEDEPLIHSKSKKRKAFVCLFDGELLNQCLQDPELRRLTYTLCSECRSVIFFRVAPQEKGAIVALVQEFEPKAITLAIGDGANDCNMIQTAHVGVGIKGKEGLQAFNSSDYGLAEFRFLRELLLVHGRWNYRRVTKMVIHTLYKNFVYVLPIVFLAATGLFSGQRVFTESFAQLYNVALTQLPVMAFGIWDQDVDRRLSVKFPQMYRAGIQNLYLRPSAVIKWIFFACWHAVIVYFIPLYSLTGYSITSVADKVGNDFWLVSNVIFIQIMLVVNIKIVLETMCPNWFTVATFITSFGFHFFLLYLQSMWPQVFPETTGVISRLLSQPIVWCLCIIVPIVALSFDVVVEVFARTFKPELHHLMQFLMRFEQEESRAKKAMLLEAIRQGGPQLLTAMGLEQISSKNIRKEESEDSDEQPEEVIQVSDDIDVALTMHERQAESRAQPPQGISTVVLELLHIKPMLEKLRGGFAFTAGDDTSVSLAFNMPLDRQTSVGGVGLASQALIESQGDLRSRKISELRSYSMTPIRQGTEIELIGRLPPETSSPASHRRSFFEDTDSDVSSSYMEVTSQHPHRRG